MDEQRAFATLHPGAVYLHMGEQFVVRELDLDRAASPSVVPADPDYYTQARDVTDIEIVRGRSSAGADVGVSFGDGPRDRPGRRLRPQARVDERDRGRGLPLASRRSTWRRGASGGRSPPG